MVAVAKKLEIHAMCFNCCQNMRDADEWENFIQF